MKKLTALISVLALMLALCACSGQAGGTESEAVSAGPATASQTVSEGPTQDVEPSEEPSAAPAEETEAPEPSEEAQPSADPETPDPTSTPAADSTPAPPVSTPAPTPAPESTPTADPKAIAIELSERRAPVSELYAAIGQPISADYAPGCIEPDSEDGELVYSGFVVYTVRTATQEYVYDVL